MGSSPSGRRSWFLAGLAALMVLAVATRAVRLGHWPLFGDEFFTLRDTSDPSFSLTSRPLVFWLNHHLVQPFVEAPALRIRLLPALFGVAGVGALGVVGRRLANERTGLIAAGLALLSPWHLAMSQFGRYYTLVFLLATVAPALLYLGVRQRSRGTLLVGAGAAVAAWFAHPTAVLPTGGFLVWLARYALVRTEGRRRLALLLAIAGSAAVGLAAAGLLLSRWTALGQEWGIGGLGVAASYVVRLGAGAFLAATAGAVLLWLDGRRERASFLASAVVVPLVAVAVLGEFVSVHTGYLFATVPYALLAAAALVDRTVRRVERRPARLAVGAALFGLVVAPGAPSFVSHYVDGGRPDFRAAARHVAARAGATDVVLADDRGPFRAYVPGLDAGPLTRDTTRLEEIRRTARQSVPPGELWIVPYLHSEGGFGLAGLGPARRWVWRHCRLSARFDPVRIDHERNIVEVWRCGDGAGP